MLIKSGSDSIMANKYTYDANGNPILVENDSTSTTREMFWDEDNRLIVLSDNGKTSRYNYNAGGDRCLLHLPIFAESLNGCLHVFWHIDALSLTVG